MELWKTLRVSHNSTATTTTNFIFFFKNSHKISYTAEFVVKEAFSVKLSHIPPASPTFNSDVETFHRLVEDEFYAIEPISSRQDLLHKMYTFLIDFNFIRKNSYKDNKTPFQLAAEKQPDFKHDLMNLPPIHLEAHFELYDQFLAKDKAFVTEKIGRADPFDDPAFEICIPNAFRKMAQRGNDVSGLHKKSITL